MRCVKFATLGLLLLTLITTTLHTTEGCAMCAAQDWQPCPAYTSLFQPSTEDNLNTGIEERERERERERKRAINEHTCIYPYMHAYMDMSGGRVYSDALESDAGREFQVSKLLFRASRCSTN